MMGRRRFLTRMILTLFGERIVARGLYRSAEAKTIDQTQYQVLAPGEAETLATWCNVIVSDSSTAGVAKFVDQSLAGSLGSSLLLLRYLNANDMPDFYRKGIAGIDQESNHRFGRPFVKLTGDQQHEIIRAAVASKMQVWTDPDPNFFYFISRSDAVDVVYGTEAGFADLGISYLAHIPPPRPW